MRAMLLIALSACTVEDGIYPPPMVLTGPSEVSLSSSHELVLSGTTPGERHTLLASAVASGPPACFSAGCVDLAAPAQALATANADANGVVQFTVDLPPGAYDTIHFQAASRTAQPVLSPVLSIPVTVEEGCQTAPPTLSVDNCFLPDLSYGAHPKQGLDLLLADTVVPSPVVVFIHGGGFTGGDKAAVYNQRVDDIEAYLDAGVSFASVNYRLLDTIDEEGVLKPLSDARYALQWLRYHADEFGIDPERVVLSGGSAGGGTSLWLATHDDMADPTAADPVEWESTRVLGASVTGTQSTYDLVRWQTDVFDVYPTFSFGSMVAADPDFMVRMASFYGLDAPISYADLTTQEMRAYRADVDIFGLMSPDDPPIRASNGNPSTVAPTDTNTLFHHGRHAVELGEQAAAAGMVSEIVAPAHGLPDNTAGSVAFVLDLLLE